MEVLTVLTHVHSVCKGHGFVIEQCALVDHRARRIWAFFSRVDGRITFNVEVECVAFGVVIALGGASSYVVIIEGVDSQIWIIQRMVRYRSIEIHESIPVPRRSLGIFREIVIVWNSKEILGCVVFGRQRTILCSDIADDSTGKEDVGPHDRAV